MNKILNIVKNPSEKIVRWLSEQMPGAVPEWEDIEIHQLQSFLEVTHINEISPTEYLIVWKTVPERVLVATSKLNTSPTYKIMNVNKKKKECFLKSFLNLFKVCQLAGIQAVGFYN